MTKRLSGTARRELIAAVRGRYLASTPPVKREILREFAAITGYHRKSVIRIMNGSAESGIGPAQRQRLRMYDEGFRATLVVLWEASDRVCGKRLQALLPSLVPALERHGHLVLDSSVRTKLLGLSAATYRKNDQAWVEQKNGSVVRRLVGYRRLEGTVVIRHGQEVGLACFEPALRGAALALWTVPVAARVIGNLRFGTRRAARGAQLRSRARTATHPS